MEVGDDHYAILGLPSGEEGAMLSDKDITKAYHLKALKFHPDKRRDDPTANDKFSQIKTSYDILMDKTARKLFDDLLRAKRQRIQRQSQRDSKRREREESAFATDPVREARRRKMMSDLEERERTAFAADPSRESQREEERISRKLKEEIERIRAMHAGGKRVNTPSSSSSFPFQKETMKKENASNGEGSLDKGEVLKVFWEKIGLDYSAQRLRDLFEQFGEVEDVVIKSTKKKRWALVVMASKDAAVAATGTMCGDLSNPLLVLPLQPAAAFPSAREPVQPDEPKLSNLVGAGYQAFEDSVLKKLQKAAERQNSK